MAASNQPLYGVALIRYLVIGATRRKLDPAAVLAVWTHEGGWYGAVGDNGTSFGPAQLHASGALPSSVWAQGADYAKTWANTPTGLDYALDGAAKVASGRKGGAAVAAIVYNFERPKDPGSESVNATNSYGGIAKAIVSGDYSSIAGGHTGGGVGSQTPAGHAVGGALQHVPGVVQGEAVVGGIKSVGDAIGWIFHNWDRALEVLGGGLLLAIGLVLLARHTVGKQTISIENLTGSVREKRGYSRGFESGQTYAEEQTGKREQAAADRKAIKRQRSSATREGYGEIPY